MVIARRITEPRLIAKVTDLKNTTFEDSHLKFKNPYYFIIKPDIKISIKLFDKTTRENSGERLAVY